MKKLSASMAIAVIAGSAFAMPAAAAGLFESALVPSTSGDAQVIRGFTASTNASAFLEGNAEVTEDLLLEVTIDSLTMAEGGFAGSFPPEGAQAVLHCAQGAVIISDPVAVDTVGLTKFEVDVAGPLEGDVCRAPVVLVIRADNSRWVAVTGFEGPAAE